MAALFTLAWTGRLSGDNETRSLIAETAVGLLELAVTFADGALQWATMEQLVPQIAVPTQPQLAAQVLGLPAEAMASEPAIGCCSTGIWACFVPLVNQEALARVQIQGGSTRIPEEPELSHSGSRRWRVSAVGLFALMRRLIS